MLVGLPLELEGFSCLEKRWLVETHQPNGIIIKNQDVDC